MGYCMSQADTQFHILAKNKHAAWEAARPLLKATDKMNGTTTMRRTHFSWVHMEEFQMSKTIEGVLKAWRWEADVDEKTGDITYVHFRGEKLGDDEALWRAIAPFVEDGSFIEMHGEDDGAWCWRFKDGKFTT